jgi:hypothetical protein
VGKTISSIAVVKNSAKKLILTNLFSFSSGEKCSLYFFPPDDYYFFNELTKFGYVLFLKEIVTRESVEKVSAVLIVSKRMRRRRSK